MSLKDQLRFLKAAAHSFANVTNPADSIALISVGSPYSEMFFTELSDPRWLPLLRSEGFFSQLPGSIRTPEGITRYPQHLPLSGLPRVADSAPALVTEILTQLEIPDNPAVADQVMRCIAKIEDANFADRLIPVLRKA